MDSNHQNSRFCPEVLIDYIIKFSIKKNVNSVSSARNDILHHMIVSISISSLFSIFHECSDEFFRRQAFLSSERQIPSTE
ncbi:MAG TPA: hypothetical protein VF084_07155 [Nitrososphaeraceae archaeon]